MKALSQTENTKTGNVHRIPCICIWVFLVVTLGWAASAAAQNDTAKPGIAAGSASDRDPATNQPAASAFSPAVSEVLKLADAGVSKEVMKAYAECSPSADPPTAAAIIAMKQHKVPDEIVTLMVRRGAQARIAVARAKQDAVARVLAARRRAAGGLDPESYEYFQHYYLQPRALASVYQRLSPYYYPWFPYP